MKLSIYWCALAVAMMVAASTSLAAEYEFQFAGSSASGDVATNGGDGYCPDGKCYAGRHGKHGHGKNGYGSGYPNGRDNYGQLGSYCGYSPPGGHCRAGWVGDCQYRWYGQPDLFYNHYAWPSCTGVGAELYVSPRPVPPHVGHTFVTYQPLMPHEMLYQHDRTYHRYYNSGQGLNRTHVKWYHVPW
jgi:uncharacterized low-complexity protein